MQICAVNIIYQRICRYSTRDIRFEDEFVPLKADATHFKPPGTKIRKNTKMSLADVQSSESESHNAAGSTGAVSHNATGTIIPNATITEQDLLAHELTLELNIPYTVLEILVAVMAIVGNAMVICVFQRERRLRRRTNYYIVSLALADLLVGLLGIPFAILASVGLPKNLYACLFTVSLLVVLCTISIFCLVAVSVDRYWAILYPLAYSKNVRTKTAIVIITFCWVLGSIVGFLPLLGWHDGFEENQGCYFVRVMDYNYLVFLYFATIITPAILLLAFYAHIYTVIIKQVKQTVTINSSGITRNTTTGSIHRIALSSTKPQSGTMLRVLGAARKREVKATQNLSIIVLFFMICWLPLYTINCVKAFCPDCFVPPALTFFAIILSHLNSAVNPLLYAYHLKDFRAALKALIFKIFGKEVQQNQHINYRFSLASQHKLNSILEKRASSLHPRIYIDSPVWLRQQHQRMNIEPPLPPTSAITCSLNNVHQTVAAVASVNGDSNMWKVIELPHGNRHIPTDFDPYDDHEPSTKTSFVMHSIDVAAVPCANGIPIASAAHVADSMSATATHVDFGRNSTPQSPIACENSAFVHDEPPTDGRMKSAPLSEESPFTPYAIEELNENGVPLSHYKLQRRYYSSLDICTTNIDADNNGSQSIASAKSMHFDNPIFSIKSTSRSYPLIDDDEHKSNIGSPKTLADEQKTADLCNYGYGLRSRSSITMRKRSIHDDRTEPRALERTRSNNS